MYVEVLNSDSDGPGREQSSGVFSLACDQVTAPVNRMFYVKGNLQ